MHKVHIILKTVTPLFLGGANPRGAPELRPTPFRGALRFWLRALLGGVLGDDVKALRDAEAKVFGSTERASSIVIRLQQPDQLPRVTFSMIAERRGKRYNKPGIAYLFFSARGTRRERERSAIKEGVSFELTMRTRLGSDADESFRQACAALWLMTHLGGVGSRVRRGAGALQVMRVQGDLPTELPRLPVQANSPEELRQELADGLQRVRVLVGSASASISQFPAFDVLHPSVCRIGVIQRTFENGWKEALEAVGSALQVFRQRRPPDYDQVKGTLQGRSLAQPIKRAAFGLPIVFYFSSLRASATLQGSKHDRRASPLWIRPVKLANGRYAVICLWFKSAFLPKEDSQVERLKLETQGRVILSDQPSDALLQTFLFGADPVKHSSLKDKGLSLLEVTGW